MLCGLGERQKQRDIFLCERHTNSGVFAATEIPSQMQDISTSSSSIHKASAQLLLSGPEKFPHYFSIHWDFALTWICFSSGEFSERERESSRRRFLLCHLGSPSSHTLTRTLCWHNWYGGDDKTDTEKTGAWTTLCLSPSEISRLMCALYLVSIHSAYLAAIYIPNRQKQKKWSTTPNLSSYYTLFYCVDYELHFRFFFLSCDCSTSPLRLMWCVCWHLC